MNHCPRVLDELHMLFVVSELVLCWKGQGKLHIRVCFVQAKGGSLLLPLLMKASVV
jgi:hypothetical protein